MSQRVERIAPYQHFRWERADKSLITTKGSWVWKYWDILDQKSKNDPKHPIPSNEKRDSTCWDKKGKAIVQKIPKEYLCVKFTKCTSVSSPSRSGEIEKYKNSTELTPEKLGLGVFLPPQVPELENTGTK